MFTALLIIILTAFLILSIKFYMIVSSGRNKTKPHSNVIYLNEEERKLWWKKRRLRYNIGLIVSGITAFITYAILGILLIAPHVNDFEITLFTIFFQGIGYLFMILLANLFFNLGSIADRYLNKDNKKEFRLQLFNLGYWFSVALPFLIPLMIVVQYFLRFSGN